jgi:uncharacterized protein YqjF (DUF2071 family)
LQAFFRARGRQSRQAVRAAAARAAAGPSRRQQMRVPLHAGLVLAPVIAWLGARWALWLLARLWPNRLGRFMRHERWDEALFMHWQLPASTVQRLLPVGLTVDTQDGHAWLGIVLLTEQGVGPGLGRRWLPAVSHHGANVRTYVRDSNGQRPGIFFFSLECSSLLACLGARLFAIPYWPAGMSRDASNAVRQMTSRRWESLGVDARIDCRWRIGAAAPGNAEPPAAGDGWADRTRWLLERYRLYTVQRGALYTGTIAHDPWPAVPAVVQRLEQSLTAAVLGLPRCSAAPDHCCFSPGVGPVEFNMLRPVC